MSRPTIKASIPHSWAITSWPPEVYPGGESRGRYIVRMHKADLIAAGALARVGRDLVIMGAAYERWLQRRRADVPDYEIAPNRERPAA